MKRTFSRLIGSLPELAERRRQEQADRAPLLAFCRWWLEGLRNLALLAALRYVATKSESLAVSLLYIVSDGIFCWYILAQVFVALDAVFSVRQAADRPILRVGRFLLWAAIFVGLYVGVSALVDAIVDEVVRAQYPAKP